MSLLLQTEGIMRLLHNMFWELLTVEPQPLSISHTRSWKVLRGMWSNIRAKAWTNVPLGVALKWCIFLMHFICPLLEVCAVCCKSSGYKERGMAQDWVMLSVNYT